MSKPCAPAADQNKDAVCAVLVPRLAGRRRLLEIGSGTGQHAVHCAPQLPELTWQTSDRPEMLPGIRQWLDEAAAPNLPPPMALDVTQDLWPAPASFDAAYSANTAQVMSWPEVEGMFAGVARVLATGGLFLLYGPFARGGTHNALSNARFDAALRARNPAQGVRDGDDLDRLARSLALDPVAVVAMPADNQILIWQRGG